MEQRDIAAETYGSRLRLESDQRTGVYGLEIDEATLDDTGDYTLIVTNDNGTVSMVVKVIVTVLECEKAAAKPTESSTAEKETILETEVTYEDILEQQECFKDVLADIRDQKAMKQKSKKTTTSRQAAVHLSAEERAKLTQEQLDQLDGETAPKVRIREVKAEVGKVLRRRLGPEPKIEIPPEPVVVHEGDLIRLSCKISGQRCVTGLPLMPVNIFVDN